MKNARTFWRVIGGISVIALVGLGMVACDTGGGAALAPNGGSGGGAGSGAGGGGSGVTGTGFYGVWTGAIPGGGGMTLKVQDNSTWAFVAPFENATGTFTMENATIARLYHWHLTETSRVGVAVINPAGSAITVTMDSDPALGAFAGMALTLNRVAAGGAQQVRITVTGIPAWYYVGGITLLPVGGQEWDWLAVSGLFRHDIPTSGIAVAINDGSLAVAMRRQGLNEPFATPGNYRVDLWVRSPGAAPGFITRTIHSRHISVGSTTIPWSDF